MRSLEQTLSSVLLVTARPPRAHPAAARWEAIMSDIAAASRDAYQSLVYDSPDFVDYFRAATPIDVIERIGGRAAMPDVALENEPAHVRVVPWMFAWTQNRCLLPYWFGAASGLAHGIERHGEQMLHDMFEHWHFFRVLVSDVGTALAKADLEIAEQHTRAWRVRCTICSSRRSAPNIAVAWSSCSP